MNQSTPLLPNFKDLPFVVPWDGLNGYFYGKAFGVKPELMALIFTIRPLAITIFYQFSNRFTKTESKSIGAHRNYLITSAIVNMIFLYILKENNFIGYLFSSFLGLAFFGQLINRVRYIQHQELQPLQEKA